MLKMHEWDAKVWNLWFEMMLDSPARGARIHSATYFSPRPYLHEYSQGSDREGFTYVARAKDVFQVSRVVPGHSLSERLAAKCDHIDYRDTLDGAVCITCGEERPSAN